MKVFESKEIRTIDEYTIRHEPVSSIDLMERAAKGCAEWFFSNIPVRSSVKIFTGPGNNGGDGWALARLLCNKGYHVEVFHLNITPEISADSRINKERLRSEGKAGIHYISNPGDFPPLHKPDIVIDALFGSGLSRPLSGLPGELVKYINKAGCEVISVDMPSGLFGEDNRENNMDTVIRANVTLTFQFPKRSFFFAENEPFTGTWKVIPIGLHPEILSVTVSRYFYTEEHEIRSLLKKRKKFSHKGNFGHGLLIAGSFGMMGAAILAARACLRTGTGLLTSHVPALGYAAIQSALPESIFSIDNDDNVFTVCPDTGKFSAIGAGPGIGKDSKTAAALSDLIKNTKKPLLLDADALNILANHPELLGILPENTIITPHPGEFDRLAGSSETGFERNLKQVDLSAAHRIIIILKGAYTSITMPDGRCYYNSTGNPGMSTAGSGDVLTGMILSLLAQGYDPSVAALAGVYIHGLAGDMALETQSEESIIASDIIENIGKAFQKIMKK